MYDEIDARIFGELEDVARARIRPAVLTVEGFTFDAVHRVRWFTAIAPMIYPNASRFIISDARIGDECDAKGVCNGRQRQRRAEAKKDKGSREELRMQRGRRKEVASAFAHVRSGHDDAAIKRAEEYGDGESFAFVEGTWLLECDECN